MAFKPIFPMFYEFSQGHKDIMRVSTANSFPQMVTLQIRRKMAVREGHTKGVSIIRSDHLRRQFSNTLTFSDTSDCTPFVLHAIRGWRCFLSQRSRTQGCSVHLWS